MLHGASVVPGEVLGLKSSNRTSGHRFMGKGEITLARATNTSRSSPLKQRQRRLRAAQGRHRSRAAGRCGA